MDLETLDMDLTKSNRLYDFSLDWEIDLSFINKLHLICCFLGWCYWVEKHI